MNRDDCEKLLDVYEIIVSAEVNLGAKSAEGLDFEIAHDNLREVILGIMAGSKEETWREPYIGKPVVVPASDKTTTLPYNPFQYTHVTAPWKQADKTVVTCEAGE